MQCIMKSNMSEVNRILILLSVVAFVFSCKKGENDPFLSLSSRKARMHGDWNLEAMVYNERSTSTDGDYTEITRHYDSGIITQVLIKHIETGNINSYDTTVITVEYATLSFDKSGTWEKELKTISKWTDKQVVGQVEEFDTVITTSHVKESGDWSFLGELEGEFKNKERIVMNLLFSEKVEQITSYYTEVGGDDTVSYADIGDQTTDIMNYYSGEQSTIIEIDRLKKKEMIFVEKRLQSGSHTILPYQGIATTSENDEFHSELTLTLHKK